jgi:hypothetical protein
VGSSCELNGFTQRVGAPLIIFSYVCVSTKNTGKPTATAAAEGARAAHHASVDNSGDVEELTAGDGCPRP